MSRVEKFIEEHTRNCSNKVKWNVEGLTHDYIPWLTPDQARKAVEIAREEIYEWLKDNIFMYNGECKEDRKAIIEDLKQVMRDDYTNVSSRPRCCGGDYTCTKYTW